MANSAARTSSDAAPASGGEYQVFLNFRGLDTRNNFTDFLYDYLNREQVRVFRDKEELHVGEVIGGNLLSAIDKSIIYIPIFSPKYASSKWCLRELAHIVDNVSKPDSRKSIIPIFYFVIPDDVKLRTQKYKKAFLELEKDYPTEAEAWRKALEEVTKFKGLSVGKHESQPEIVHSVVERVLQKLKTKKKIVTEHLVGLKDQVEDLRELLDVTQDDVRLIEIYGMGGLGKTTIAKVVFNELFFSFGKYCCFLEDVREKSTKEDGMVKLQKTLLSEIGSRCVENVQDKERGMMTIGEILNNKKILMVLDDVDKTVPIKNLIGNSKLYKGSRIIITTREKGILEVGQFEGKIEQHEMLKMNDALALRLFCQHAFDRDSPLDDYHDLSSKIVSLMEGLPLAMEVVGLSLRRKGKDLWKETLERLSTEPEKEIREKLKISYDDLENDHKQIFLDIACFLFNEKKTDATYIWDQCKFYPLDGLDVLEKRCLIKILDNDQFCMHNQLIALGRHIVRQESSSKCEEPSRLWVAEEALNIIRTNKIKDKVRAIKMDELNNSVNITNEEFKRLTNLRLLKLGNGTYATNFAKYCSKLGWISCRSPNWYLMGGNTNLNTLIVIKLYDTSFTDDAKAWDFIKSAQNLKVLSLTQCGGITTIPNFSNCLGLQKLTLTHCDRLKRIKSFIGDLKSLIELKIECCKSLTDMPEEVGALENLKRFSLRGCSQLRKLPRSLGKLTSLVELDLLETGIVKIPDSMEGLLKLESFLLIDKPRKEFHKFIEKSRALRVLSLPKNGSYSPEHHVWRLPGGTSMLKILEEYLSRCDEMTNETPVGIGDLSSFTILNLTSTQICNIRRNIDILHHLQTLNLGNHNEIQGLLQLPSRTINMLHQPRQNLKSLVHHPSSLLRLDLVCPSFRWADLFHSGLVLRNLTTLEFYYVEVEDIPLDRLLGLESLIVHSCELLQRLTISSEHLRQAHLSYCPDLVYISFSFSEKLESFFVSGCGSLEKIDRLDCMKNLQKLEIQQCNELTDVLGLEHLESLKSLEVTQCPSLRRLIDASYTKIPDDCHVKIQECGDFVKDSTQLDSSKISLKCYREKILMDTPNLKYKSNKGGAEFDILGPDEVSDFASMSEGETGGTSSIADFRSKPGNSECFEATGKRSKIRDGRIGHYDSVDGGKTASMENRKKDKDENGEPANPRDAVESSCQTSEGAEHYETSCKSTTEVEDQRDPSYVKRDRTVESAEVLAKTGKGSGTICASNPGRNPTNRGRASGIASSSRNNKASRSGRDASSTTGKGTASNFGRGISSSSLRSATSRIRGSTLTKGTTSSSGRGTTVGLETDRDSILRRGTTQMGGSSRSGHEDPHSEFVGEREIDGTSSINDFLSGMGNVECPEATGNRRQTRDRRIGHYGSVDEGKTASLENRKKEKNEIGESASQNDVGPLNFPSGGGVEHCGRSCKAITEVEDETDLSSVDRDRTIKTDGVPAKRGRARVTASSSRNSKASRPGRDAATTFGKGMASDSGRDIVSSSQSSTTLSSGRGTTKKSVILRSA